MNYAQVLGLVSIDNERDVKRAYAKLIKQFRPETHPAEFGEIRTAYEYALTELSRRSHKKEYTARNIELAPVERDTPKKPRQQQGAQAAPSEATPNPDAQNAISKFINQLEELSSKQDEPAAQLHTRQYLRGLSELSLDEKLNIEVALLTWVFNTDKPLLLAFIEMDSYFQWTIAQAFAERKFFEWESRHLGTLRHLAKTYADALSCKSSNLASAISFFNLPIQTYSQYEERKRWRSLCDQYGYDALKDLFKSHRINRFPVLWADIYIALIFGMMGSVYTQGSSALICFLTPIVMFSLALAFNVFTVPVLFKRSGQARFLSRFKVALIVYAIVLATRIVGHWIDESGLGGNHEPGILNQNTNSTLNNKTRDNLIGEFGPHNSNEKAATLTLDKNTALDVIDIGENRISLPPQCYGIENRKPPIYPEISRMRGEKGELVVKLQVDATGAVVSAKIITSSGYKRLDDAALDAVSEWCFLPFKKNNKAVAVTVNTPINFSLKN